MKNVPIPNSQRQGSGWMVNAETTSQIDRIKEEKQKIAHQLYPLNSDQEQLNNLLK